jgi:hypothetical protein
MKNNKSTILVFGLLILACSLYRVWDGRPFGFAPQIAMALFAGSVIKDKKISFLFPILSMLVSDALYQLLYIQGLSIIKGFYSGQLENYLLIALVTVIGFAINKNKLMHIVAGSLAGAVFYFIASNFVTWLGGGLDINNQPYPKTWEGLTACFTAALPFFKWSIYSTLIFNAIFFGCYYLYSRYSVRLQRQAA